MNRPAAVYVQEYHEEYARNAAQMKRDGFKLERRQSEAARNVENLVAAVAAGAGDFAEFREMLTQARADRDAAGAALDEINALPVVALHTRLADNYRSEVAALHEALADPQARLEAAPLARLLIERIVISLAEQGRAAQLMWKGDSQRSLRAPCAIRCPACSTYCNGGAGEGNRTLVVSLGSFCSTIELHPHKAVAVAIRSHAKDQA